MNIGGKNLVYIVIASGVAYALYKTFGGAAKLAKNVDDFFAALNFDPASLGPVVSLQPAVQDGIAEYVKLGYMAYKDGRTIITPLGNQFLKLNRDEWRSKGWMTKSPATGNDILTATGQIQFESLRRTGQLGGFERQVYGSRIY